MKHWLYPKTIESVKRACALYLAGELEIGGLQSCLYLAENDVVAHEERWLRAVFSDCSNKIEEICYTESTDRQPVLIGEAVRRLLDLLEGGAVLP
ncbi:hypothetical protein [Luteibacter rhizovicinus]|uniref:hypothetical protein n=1 Tax=Luteibacter rhizovicinus TaxID=242606 RepID=UPI00104443B8|nr:hypothetical protein [Luteibacter rhizovicinus]